MLYKNDHLQGQLRRSLRCKPSALYAPWVVEAGFYIPGGYFARSTGPFSFQQHIHSVIKRPCGRNPAIINEKYFICIFNGI